MAKQVAWNQNVVEAFINEGNLNRRQEYIIRTRILGYSIARQASDLHLSIDQVNKEIRQMKRIYDKAQAKSSILPKRLHRRDDILLTNSKSMS